MENDERLEQLIHLEYYVDTLRPIKKNVKTMNEKKDKYRDALTALKEGKVQKDLKLWNYFDSQPGLFLKMTRKETLNLIEKEIGGLSKEISRENKALEDLICKIKELIKSKPLVLSIRDLDDDILELVEASLND